MKWQQTAATGFLMGACFVLGQIFSRPILSSPVLRGPALEAQGRGPTNPPPSEPVDPTPNTVAAAPLVYPEDSGGQAVSANGFLAVTGSYGVGTSVLYLVDTVNRQLAVYEARGGSAVQRRVVLVGARKIDLDLQLEGYNDRSEYDYRELRRVFERRGAKDVDVTSGLDTGGSERK